MRGARKIGLAAHLVLCELIDNVSGHDYGIFVGFAEHDPKAIAVTQLPCSAFHLAPMMVFAYNEGDRSFVREIGSRTRQWLVELGHAEVLTMNLRHSDRSLLRSFRHFGEPEATGLLVRFRFGE